jgi:hypothetical protein
MNGNNLLINQALALICLQTLNTTTDTRSHRGLCFSTLIGQILWWTPSLIQRFPVWPESREDNIFFEWLLRNGGTVTRIQGRRISSSPPPPPKKRNFQWSTEETLPLSAQCYLKICEATFLTLSSSDTLSSQQEISLWILPQSKNSLKSTL